MIPVLIERDLRSVFVGLADAACTSVSGICNVPAHKAGLVVLAGALTMPLLMLATEHLQLQSAKSDVVFPAFSMTLLQELQAILEARSGPGLPPSTAPTPTNSSQAEKSSSSTSASDTKELGPFSSEPAPRQAHHAINGIRAGESQPVSQCARVAISQSSFNLSIYVAAGALFLRRRVFLSPCDRPPTHLHLSYRGTSPLRYPAFCN